MQKKIPMRQCLGCREMKPKRELTRVVRTPEGTVCIDRKGKANGRGAYLCANTECLKRPSVPKRWRARWRSRSRRRSTTNC